MGAWGWLEGHSIYPSRQEIGLGRRLESVSWFVRMNIAIMGGVSLSRDAVVTGNQAMKKN